MTVAFFTQRVTLCGAGGHRLMCIPSGLPTSGHSEDLLKINSFSPKFAIAGCALGVEGHGPLG